MPRKNIIRIKLPPEQPDTCASCPLLGLIPKELRQNGVRQSFACLGTMDALTSKGIHSSAAAYKQMGRKWHRPCDAKWDAWMQLPGREFGISYQAYLQSRLPYEQKQQLIFHFKR